MASLTFFRSLLKGRERAAAAATAVFIVAIGWLWLRPVEPSRDPAGIPQLEEVARLEAPTVIPLRFPGVRAVAWSPNGKRIAALHSVGSGISVWENGKLLLTIKRAETTGGALSASLLFLSDNRTLLAPAPTDGDNKKASFGLWDTDTGSLKRLIAGPHPDDWNRKTNTANKFILSPDGRHVAMISRFSGDGVILFDTANWQIIAHRRFQYKDLLVASSRTTNLADEILSATALAFANSETLIIGTIKGIFALRIPDLTIISYATDVDGTFRRIEGRFMRDGDVQRIFVTNLATRPNGSELLVGRSTIRDYQAREVANAAGKKDEKAFAKVAPARIWDLVAEREGPYLPEVLGIVDFVWSPNGQKIAVLTESRRLLVYDFYDKRPHLMGFVNLIDTAISVAFSPDSKHLAVGDQQFVRIFKTR